MPVTVISRHPAAPANNFGASNAPADQPNFQIRVRTSGHLKGHIATAVSSISAYMAAADAQGDTPYGITVMPA